MIVLIVPSTFPRNIRLFQAPIINSLVNYFVLQYYDTARLDYNSYSSLFESSQTYQSTALFQYMKNATLVFDVCRTLIALPTSSSSLLNPSQFVSASVMQPQLLQAYNSEGWFGGLADLFQDTNNPNFTAIALNSVQEQCNRNEKCIC